MRTINLGRQIRFVERDVEASEGARRLTTEALANAVGMERLGGTSTPVEPPATELAPRRAPACRKAVA